LIILRRAIGGGWCIVAWLCWLTWSIIAGGRGWGAVGLLLRLIIGLGWSTIGRRGRGWSIVAWRGRGWGIVTG